MSFDGSPSRAWIELDRSALAHNVNTLRALLPPGCTLMPAVKADAYGHGAALLVPALVELGVEDFCVATAGEGIQLRQWGVSGQVLVLGYTHPSQATVLSRHGLTQTVTDLDHGLALQEQGVPLRVQLKLDTGMHRLGQRWEQAEELARLFALPNLQITGAFTHLCAAGSEDPADQTFTLEQGRRFWAAVENLRARGCDLPAAHLLASDGLLRYPQLGGSHARVGIALYGLLSTGEALARCPALLRPVLSLKARVAQVRELLPGESAGYDRAFVPDRPARLAVLTVGYADGLPRGLSCGVGSALVNGRRCPIVGRVCMDQTLVDVTGTSDVVPGDTAVLIGRQGEEEIGAWELAEQTGTITNEIVSRLGQRLERVWLPRGPSLGEGSVE